MTTRFSFPGVVRITTDGPDEHFDFIPANDERLHALILPEVRTLSAACQVTGTIPGGVTGCNSVSCERTCTLKSSSSGSTTTYWCSCE